MQVISPREHDVHLWNHGSMVAFESWPPSGSPNGYFPAGIDDEAVRFFNENGFLVIQNAFNQEELAGLIEETTAICRGDHGEIAGLPASTEGETTDDILKRVLCVHFPHKISSVIRSSISHPAFVDVLTKIVSPNVKCMQSMLFIKGAGKPGQAWHQDEDFIPTRDRSLVGGWIALDDATVENGCLWVIPGSHKRGILWPMIDHGDSRFDCARESSEFPYSAKDEIPVEMKAGSVVFFNGYLLHRSLPNRKSAGYRRSLVHHYMSAESMLPWFSKLEEGGHVARADYRDIIMVAGQDPYRARGITDLARPSIRPTGDGGCGKGAGQTKPRDEAAPRMG